MFPKNSKALRICLLFLWSGLIWTWVSRAQPESPLSASAFRYQGRLLENGAPAQGPHAFRFALFANESGGSPQGPGLATENVAVSNGLFTAVLDFGRDVFTGTPCWLEIGVYPAGIDGECVVLSPRQQLTPTPFAIYTLKAESLAGPLPDAQLSTNIARLDANQTFTGQITFSGTVQAGALSGDGAGLKNVAAAALSARLMERQWRVAIPFVAVTNAANAPDELTGRGAVPYNFRMGKFEVNNLQYAAFLNAVAVEDPHKLYSTNMTADIHGGILRSGSPGDYHYTLKPGMEHHPVVWADFHDALRFCNWLHHGQPTGRQDVTTTEDGAYTMTAAGEAANTIVRNPGARFWIPSDDEWYKAAYYQPWSADGSIGEYWLYPTQSNDAPFSEMPPGDINSANVCCETQSMATDVGAYVRSPTYYGTFDQAGNVEEWTEDIIYVTNRGLRGGSWYYGEFYTSWQVFSFDTTDYDGDSIGFRVAGALEP